MDKNKKDSPDQIKKNVQKKLFAGQMKRQNSYGDPEKKKSISTTKVNTSGSYDFRDKDYGELKEYRREIKKKTADGNVERLSRTVKKVSPKENVFQSIKDSTQDKSPKTKGGFGVFTGNATDLRSADELKVGKKHQSRVNKILGK